MSIAYDCENIPPKEDQMDTNIEQAQPLTADTTTTTSTNNAIIQTAKNRFNAQFQQRSKQIRELIAEQRLRLNNDNSQILFIILISLIAIACSISALTTNYWIGDEENNFGLWNTCFVSEQNLLPINTNSTDIVISNDSSLTNISINNNRIMCGKQLFHTILIEPADQSRIDQVSAAQGLIVCGTILYILSIVGLSFAYRFVLIKNLNSVRNVLVTSVLVQILSFFMQLIGFFLYILTDRISMSVSLLFVYFALAIFSTNIINFITIEYKSYKIRQLSSI